MTISSSTNKVLLNGNGFTTTFTFNFALLKSDYSDLYVYQIDVDEDTQEETQTLLTAGIDYNISVLKDTNLNILGGSITTTFVPTINQKIFIVREENLLQETKIEINQKFPERVIELTLDKLTLQNQQQQSLIDKCLKISQTSNTVISNFADTPVENMGVVWKKNDNGEFYLSNTKNNPDTVYNDIVSNPNVVAVASNINNVNMVATSIGNVYTNAMNINSINTNAANISNINIVANNLDIQRNLVIGELKHFARTDVPSGWLRCDGTQYTRSEFPNFWDNYLIQSKIPICDYTYYNFLINNTGNCGFFAVDLVNLTFKVPTIQGQVFISQALASGDIGKFNAESLPQHIHYNGIADDVQNLFNYGATREDLPGNATRAMNSENNNIGYQGLTSKAKNSTTYQDSAIVQPNNIQYPIFVCVANIQVPVSEAQYNGFINNLNQKVDLDGSNANFGNLSYTAKNNILQVALGGLQNYQDIVGNVRHIESLPNDDLYLPSGGTWLVLSRTQIDISTGIQYLYSTDDIVTSYGAILSGGARLLAGRNGYTAKAIIMKIQ